MESLLKKILRQAALMTSANLAGFGGFLMYYVPNSIGLEKTKEVTQIYRNLQPTTVSDDLEHIKDEVMKDMQISEEVKSQVELYHLCGFTPFSFGSTWKPPIFQGFNRAIIGIPLNYCQEDKIFSWKDIVIMEKGKGKEINWTSAEGRQLKTALTLSEKAKKFAIAQQIYRTSTSEVFSKAALTAVMFPLTYAMAKTINEKGSLLKKPQKLRFLMYSFVLFFNVALWTFLKDLLINNIELSSDEAVALLGKDYIEGGLEYYNKQLNANLSLRTIQGKKGEKLYTLFGNESTFLRQKHVPITQRRDFFKIRLQDQPLNIEYC